MSWDGRGMVRFPVGCVRSSALGVVFSKVAFLCLSALLDPVLCAWLALWDADLIDADSLEWELAGVVRTFRKRRRCVFKGHLFAFLLVSAGSGVVFVVAGRLRAVGFGVS